MGKSTSNFFNNLIEINLYVFYRQSSVCASYQLGPPTFDHLPQVLDWIEGFAAGAAEGVAVGSAEGVAVDSAEGVAVGSGEDFAMDSTEGGAAGSTEDLTP